MKNQSLGGPVEWSLETCCHFKHSNISQYIYIYIPSITEKNHEHKDRTSSSMDKIETSKDYTVEKLNGIMCNINITKLNSAASSNSV